MKNSNLSGSTSALVFPCQMSDHVVFFNYGRAALSYGLGQLGIVAGDAVMLPDYLCHVLLAPLRERGVTPVYYQLDENLVPDWSDVQRKCGGKVKAFLMIHYFGFPNDVEQAQQFCRRNGIYFIEDNAHGFLSAKGNVPLGSFGDIGIFSFYKTLDMPQGGGVVFNRVQPSYRKPERRFFAAMQAECVFGMKILVRKTGVRNLWVRPRLSSIMTEAEQVQEVSLRGFSGLLPLAGVRQIRRCHAQGIRQKRRRNYLQWKNYFDNRGDRDVRLLQDQLPDGVVPYVFPVLSRNREEFINRMHRVGVRCFPWPHLPTGVQGHAYAKQLVCLPLDGCERVK